MFFLIQNIQTTALYYINFARLFTFSNQLFAKNKINKIDK